MKIIKSIKNIRKEVATARKNGKTIGFVPTMGAFHDGHLSLMRKARKENAIVIVSVFVNPTQFGPQEDFDKYPRDFDRDQKLAEAVGVDLIFYPSVNEIYPKQYFTYVNVLKLTDGLCGKTREQHFEGVVTVVTKLFNIVLPDVVYFGQKDFQQFVVIKQMVKDLNMMVKVKRCRIVREKDGLAMSSRNIYLSEKERKNALSINSALRVAEDMIKKGERNSQKLIKFMNEYLNKVVDKVDYIEIVSCDNLQPVSIIDNEVCLAIACFVGKTRLIDNVIVKI